HKPGPPLSALHLKSLVPRFQGMTLLSLHQHLAAPELAAILDSVRNRILDFVLAIQAEQPNAGEAALNAPQPPIPLQTLTQVFHTTIVGGQANLGNMGPASIGDGNVATGSTSTGTPYLKELLSRFQTEANNLKVPKADRAEAIE